LYPIFTQSKYLGETGEILLTNTRAVVQSPLKYRDGAISTLTISAEPAKRGAAGSVGIIAAYDYRPKAVMAAYGHIDGFNWGIVVKQDMSEINAPVRVMARNVTGVSAGVLLFSLFAGFFIARRISRPALSIAETAVLIGEGNSDIRVVVEGPAEIQQIAVNMNLMVEQLGSQFRATREIGAIIAATGKHNRVSELLAEVLPALMEATKSQLGVVYLSDGDENKFNRKLVHGLGAELLEKQITVKPPDHLLAEDLLSGEI